MKEDDKLIYRTLNGFDFYIVPALFLVAAALCWWYNAHYFVTGFLMVIFIAAFFRERFNIYYYDDHFAVTEDFLPGSLMRVTRRYYFNRIQRISIETEPKKITVKDRMILLFAGWVIYLFFKARRNENMQLVVSLVYLDKNDQPVDAKLNIPLQGQHFKKTMDMINWRVSEEQSAGNF